MDARNQERNGQGANSPFSGSRTLRRSRSGRHPGEHVEQRPTVPPLAGVTLRPAASIRAASTPAWPPAARKTVQ